MDGVVGNIFQSTTEDAHAEESGGGTVGAGSSGTACGPEHSEGIFWAPLGDEFVEYPGSSGASLPEGQ
eukprot:4280225-Heterocapsa_arctica.AAC.1